MENQNFVKTSWLDKPLSDVIPRVTVETLVIAVVLLLTVVTRLYNLDARVMSHDEVNHVVPSWDMYEGRVYRHDPVTHGPLQFHLIAFSYFLFGDNDFTSRLPHALSNIATVAFVIFAFRRFLGRRAALIAGVLVMISPYMLFYGRYARNDIIVVFFMALMFYAVWRYLETGKKSSLFLLTTSLVFQFTLKEVAYIHAAQLLLFLAVLYFADLNRSPAWIKPDARKRFVLFVILLVVFVLAAVASGLWMSALANTSAPAVPAIEGDLEPLPAADLTLPRILLIVTVLAALLSFALALVTVITGLGWGDIRGPRSFDLLMLTGSLILPTLVAFPVKLIGWSPLDYSTTGMLRTGAFVLLLFLLSIAAGMWWNWRKWLLHAALFWGVFIVFYTSFFTNTQGFFTGLVGSLGYWLDQQAVQRGSQPFYYYALVQIPVYEYLPALGTIAAGIALLRKRVVGVFASEDEESISGVEDDPESTVEITQPAPSPYIPVLALLIYWAVTALLAYSYAGEKMPQMTLYTAFPMILIAGWYFSRLIDQVDWDLVFKQRGLVAVLLLPVFLAAFSGLIGSLLGTTPPFQGNTLDELRATNQFFLSFLATAASLGGIIWLVKDWEGRQVFSLAGLVVFLAGALLTARTAYTASYINYDTAQEYLTYAHAARGPKDILEQVEEISRRTTGGLEVRVAYDSDGLYPYWWYFRDYPNHRWYGDNPTRELRDYPLIIASEALFGKIEPVVQNNYTAFETIRLWWPNQDYYNLTPERVWNALTDPALRAGVFDIWLNRDYERYAAATSNTSLSLENWRPADRIRLYIRKDIIADIWEYGSMPVMTELMTEDPYERNLVQLMPDTFFGGQGVNPGEFSSPRGIAVGLDGSVYVADQLNHRIQHFSASGELLHSWGGYGNVGDGSAHEGRFNEPWGVAVGPDGSVYVSDTWNYRIQKFTADGQFITMWGASGQGESATAFYGPRGLAVDAQGKVYVADTGNKRIVVFNSDGGYITQFGAPGMELGQLDEPVDIALDSLGNVYVTDTWNQRVHVFASTSDDQFFPVMTWEINGWFSNSIDNKPYIAVDPVNEYVFVTDPEGYRVLQFDLSGVFVRGWGDYSPDIDGFGLPIGIAVDSQGRVWVSDSVNHRVLRFDLSGLPEPVDEAQPGAQEMPGEGDPLDENLLSEPIE